MIRLIFDLLLRRLAVGDVDDRAFEHAVVHQRDVLDDPDRRAVVTAHAQLLIRQHFLFLHHLQQALAVGQLEVERLRRLREHLLARLVSEHPREGVVAIENAAVGRRAIDAGKIALDERAIALFIAPPLGDVLRDDEARAPSGGLEIERRALDVEHAPALIAMAENARPVLVAERLHVRKQRRHVFRRANVGDLHLQKFAARPAVVRDRRIVHGHELQRLEVVDPHRQRIELEEHPVAMLARAQRRFRALALRVVGGDVDDGDRLAGVVADERRLHEDVDGHAVRRAPHHRLLEDAGALEELAGGLVALALDDEANVRAGQRLRVVAEEVADSAVGDANMTGHVDDEHCALHRVEDRFGRVLRRDVDHLEAPDRRRGHDHERDHEEVSDRTAGDAERREVVDEREHPDAARDQQHLRPFAGVAIGLAIRGPDQSNAVRENAEVDDDRRREEEARRGIEAPREMMNGWDERRRRAERREDRAKRPRRGDDAPKRALASDVNRREVKDGRSDQCGGEVPCPRPEERGAGVARRVHQCERAEPAADRQRDRGKQHPGCRHMAAHRDADPDDDDRGSAECRGKRETIRAVGSAGKEVQVFH